MMKITRKTHNISSTCHTSANPLGSVRPSGLARWLRLGLPTLGSTGGCIASSLSLRSAIGYCKGIHFFVLSMLVVLLGGLLTLFWQEQQRQVTHAAGEIVVGSPSLSATTVDALFKRVGSPMAGTGKVVEKASRDTNIDDAFALAVWWAETNDGMAGVGLGYRNPGGVQASYGYARYPSYASSVEDWFNIVKSRYIDRGLTSVYTISGPYVGTSGALNWANKVMNYMSSYRASSPHPGPKAVVKETPVPTPTPVVVKTPAPTSTGVVQTKTNTYENITSLKQAQKQQVRQPVASTKLNTNMTNTQLLLTGTGVLITLLLGVPGLLIHRKRRTLRQRLKGISMANLTFEPEQATNRLPVTTTLRMEAISTQQLKPRYVNQHSPVLEDEAVNTINTSQLACEFDVLPSIPTSPSLTEPILQPVAVAKGEVPPTPLQRVPPTPYLQVIPATPLLPRNSQGALLPRHNMQSRPRRVELIRPPERKNPRKIFTPYGEREGRSLAGPRTETLHED